MTAFVAHWFFWLTGARNESGTAYGLLSGVGGALPDLLMLSGLAAWYWHRSCHVSACWRPGRHQVDGTPYRTCRRHHPGGLPRRVRHDDVKQAHRETR